MRKISATIVAILFALSLCACGKAENIPTGNQAPMPSQADNHTIESNESTTNYETTTNASVATESTTEDTTPVHIHNFSSATCTKPATCSCGAIQGSPNGHNFTDGNCANCGMADPDYQKAASVWIPTNGGKKYHKSASCSNMKNPEEVTKSEAESRGFEPCKRCY